MAASIPSDWVFTKTLEMVPNPNTGQPAFSRWTWICTDARGSYVCSSGAEDDCRSQALSMIQAHTQ